MFVLKVGEAMSLLESQPILSGPSDGSSEATRDFGAAEGGGQIPSPRLRLFQLDFEELAAFEPVGDRYANLGIHFMGAVALMPSNPAFPPHSGSLVLMPVANQLGITVELRRPARLLGAFAIGSKPVRLTAFDKDNNRIARAGTEVSGENSRIGHRLLALPHYRLEVQARNIVKAIFDSAAPFILDDVFFYCELG